MPLYRYTYVCMYTHYIFIYIIVYVLYIGIYCGICSSPLVLYHVCGHVFKYIFCKKVWNTHYIIFNYCIRTSHRLLKCVPLPKGITEPWSHHLPFLPTMTSRNHYSTLYFHELHIFRSRKNLVFLCPDYST
jgi:hypothetical protein